MDLLSNIIISVIPALLTSMFAYLGAVKKADSKIE